MIRIERDSGWADKLRAYRVLVDGKQVGTIREGETQDFEVAPGRHQLALKVDWCRTPPIVFEEKGEIQEFSCGSNVRGPKLILTLPILLFTPSRYLWLRKL